MPEPASNRFEITLVHGTWGQGFFTPGSIRARIWNCVRKDLLGDKEPKWFQDESKFSKALKTALAANEEAAGGANDPAWVVREPILWSGSNSVFERDAAAKRLADRLRVDLQDPHINPVIIAHSHGGNLALRAMHYLGDQARRVRVITLATPFLRVNTIEKFDVPFGTKLLLWAGLVFILFVPVIGGLIYFEDVLPKNRAIEASAIALMGIGFIGSFFLLKLLISRIINPDAVPSGRGNRPNQIADAAHYDTAAASAPAMLVVRGVDDEASMSLAAGAIGARLSVKMLQRWLYSLLAVVFFALGVIDTYIVNGGVDFILPHLMVGVSFAAMAMLFLAGIFKSVLGREFFVGAWRCEIAVDSAPDRSGPIKVITLPPVGETLRHAIYEHPECVRTIADWLNREQIRIVSSS